tara:strand:- start:2119 stop:2307 length:189 start_codon:yes stop_codon:yes gene_type:complete
LNYKMEETKLQKEYDDDVITNCHECQEVIPEEDFLTIEEKYVWGGVLEIGYDCHCCGFQKRY